MFSYATQVHTISIVITLITKTGASEELKNRVQNQMAMLGRKLGINISVAKVDRFGKTIFYVMFDYHVFKDGCSSDKTVIPSHSGKQDLVLMLF